MKYSEAVPDTQDDPELDPRAVEAELDAIAAINDEAERCRRRLEDLLTERRARTRALWPVVRKMGWGAFARRTHASSDQVVRADCGYARRDDETPK